MLLSYYLEKDTTAMKLRCVRESLDDFVRLNRGDVEEIEDSSCEVVAKEEIKAEEEMPKVQKRE